jgi:hypothetical protein
MRVTSPISTPRYLSFDPNVEPCTDSLKYVSTDSAAAASGPTR